MRDIWENMNYSAGEAGLLAGGALSSQQGRDFYKALQADYGTDQVGLTGGGALRRESLEQIARGFARREPRDGHRGRVDPQ